MECSAPSVLRKAPARAAGAASPQRRRTVAAAAGVTSRCGSRRRRNWRLPTCSTRPSSALGRAGRGRRRASGSPSSCTPPWASIRRASERERPNALGDHGRQVHRAVAGRDHGLLDLLGQLVRDEQRGRTPPRPRRAAASEWKRVTSARARARLASRGPAPAGGSLAEQQREPRRDLLVGDAQRLAVHLLGRVGDADVVAERLRHLLRAVDARSAAASSARPAAAGRRRAGSRGPSAG